MTATLRAAIAKINAASEPSRVVQVSAGLALGASVDMEGDPRGARFEPMFPQLLPAVLHRSHW